MSAEMQKVLAEMLASLNAAAQQVGAVAKEQLPLLVQEYLKWGFVNAAVDGAICAMLLCTALLTCRFLAAHAKQWDDESNYGNPTGYIMGVVMGIVSCMLFACLWGNVSTMLQIYVAPRVYMLEQVKGLMK